MNMSTTKCLLIEKGGILMKITKKKVYNYVHVDWIIYLCARA